MAKKKAAANKAAPGKKVRSYGVDEPDTLEAETVAPFGSGFLLATASGNAPAGVQSAKAWVYTTFLPFVPPTPPPCAVLRTFPAGGAWTYSGLPSPLGNAEGTVPNTFVIWYYASTDGSGPVHSSAAVYFFGKIGS